MGGIFITFEGGEGSGKSTQSRLLSDKLKNAGIDVVQTREPGGAPQAELIRELLVTGEVDRWSPEAECLLNYAARDAHLRETIIPALQADKWVICDRFSDSTKAYQGGAGGVSKALIDAIDAQVVGRHQPDLTVIFDIPAHIGLERAQARGTPDRFERKGLAFHDALREAFLAIADNEPERCAVVDASATIEDIAGDVWHLVSTRFGIEP